MQHCRAPPCLGMVNIRVLWHSLAQDGELKSQMCHAGAATVLIMTVCGGADNAQGFMLAMVNSCIIWHDRSLDR